MAVKPLKTDSQHGTVLETPVKSREMYNGTRRFWQAMPGPGLLSAFKSNAEQLGKVQKRAPGTIKN